MKTVEWTEVTEDRYHEMLNILPPAFWSRGLFLVGEAWDHTNEGVPRFQAFREHEGKYWVASRPMTRAEVREIVGPGCDLGFGPYAEEG